MEEISSVDVYDVIDDIAKLAELILGVPSLEEKQVL